MSDPRPQSFENHAKLVTGYHFVAFGLLVVNLGWALWTLFRHPSVGTAMALGVAIALVLVCLYARIFPLAVQDRLIRLEERIRIARVAPDLDGRLDTLTPRQMVALRFASDEEVGDLARKVLDEGLTDGKAIKRLIKTWRPDHFRM